jgi:hypothetical protein
MPGTRPPFQGDSLGDVFPRLKPMGCSVFALWAMRNVQTADAGGDARATFFACRLSCLEGREIIRLLVSVREFAGIASCVGNTGMRCGIPTGD